MHTWRVLNEDDAHRFTRGQIEEQSNGKLSGVCKTMQIQSDEPREQWFFARLCKCHVEEGFSPKHPERFVESFVVSQCASAISIIRV